MRPTGQSGSPAPGKEKKQRDDRRAVEGLTSAVVRTRMGRWGGGGFVAVVGLY